MKVQAMSSIYFLGTTTRLLISHSCFDALGNFFYVLGHVLSHIDSYDISHSVYCAQV